MDNATKMEYILNILINFPTDVITKTATMVYGFVAMFSERGDELSVRNQ